MTPDSCAARSAIATSLRSGEGGEDPSAPAVMTSLKGAPLGSHHDESFARLRRSVVEHCTTLGWPIFTEAPQAALSTIAFWSAWHAR
jgi:hypothetical protein